MISETEAAMDGRLLVEQLGDDPEMLRDLIRLVGETNAECLDAIRSAYAAADAASLARAAHKLKGSLFAVTARPAGTAAANVEAVARSGELAAAPAAIDALERELGRLEPALAAFLADAT